MLRPIADRAGNAPPAPPLSHRDVLGLAVPIMLSNATTPLIGFVDTVVIGQTGEAHLIGGVAVGALVFSVLYWSFAFLRMGTTGLTAQAHGASDGPEVAATLWRAVLIGLACGGTMVTLQVPILAAARWAIGGSPAVDAALREYYGLRIWGAPAGLVNFALLGWLIGLGRTGLAFVVQLLVNALNIGLAVLLVAGLGLGVRGVGAAALLAEVLGAAAGIILALRVLAQMGAHASRAQIRSLGHLSRLLAINRDIAIRTLAGLTVITFFASRGAAGGDVVLAANAVLLNINHITVYLIDGYAHAAETLVGQAIGAGKQVRFRAAVAMTTWWAAATGITASACIWLAGPAIIDVMTASSEVRAAARGYLIWAALAPIIGVWCFQLDGIFIGATRTADMRNMMLVSLAAFFAAWWLLRGFGNHGLWASLLLFNVARAATLLARFPALERHCFGGTTPKS